MQGPRIPVLLVSGALGAGKTTAIRHWLTLKPSDERWTVLVNEFGQVGLDGILLGQSPGVRVEEIAGGCICCSSGPLLRAVLRRIVRERPHLLIIEPTGLASPARLYDLLREPEFAPHVRVERVVTLVDVRVFAETDWADDELYLDQVNLADVLIGSKADLAGPAVLENFRRRAAALYPPKREVLSSGADGPPFPYRRREAVSGHREPPIGTALFRRRDTRPPQPLAGRPSRGRFVSSEAGIHGFGWILSPATVFSLPALKAFFDEWPRWARAAGLEPLRAKAVLRCGGAWRAFNWIDDRLTQESIAWRRDSRIEFLTRGPNEVSWRPLEERLTQCML